MYFFLAFMAASSPLHRSFSLSRLAVSLPVSLPVSCVFFFI
ncbi:hypothetical protein CSUI_008287 [Cystoisospora suis]|uniref:Uncharacterized protein n=1 Tax=Cystoisospora suis TaxID=483139 RepID=A0A2C6KL84_9APIC|nr:hypothetical protein CSUI_008287 [Cystoisospora suis]